MIFSLSHLRLHISLHRTKGAPPVPSLSLKLTEISLKLRLRVEEIVLCRASSAGIRHKGQWAILLCCLLMQLFCTWSSCNQYKTWKPDASGSKQEGDGRGPGVALRPSESVGIGGIVVSAFKLGHFMDWLRELVGIFLLSEFSSKVFICEFVSSSGLGEDGFNLSFLFTNTVLDPEGISKWNFMPAGLGWLHLLSIETSHPGSWFDQLILEL